MIGPIPDVLSDEGVQPHGMCLMWRADVVWTTAVGNLLTGLAHLLIPLALVCVAARRTAE